ncbi:MAG: SAM-dependent methyltransferase [Lachnospiraceae bacterium]|nr:SAM-dependent methyltransferase [Lachnospiraceae bacterium]
MIRLSKRLQSVADFVEPCETMADVGTDHGYIPVYLVGCQRVKKAIALDVNRGPLLRAQEHILQHDMKDCIETRQSDGFAALRPGEAETIVIAGMGGALMMRILDQGEEKARAAERLVLQPQSEWMAFRRFLYENQYQITAEDMVYEDGKYYPVMAVSSGQAKEKDSRIQWKYGSLLLARRHPVLEQYLRKQQQQKRKILQNLEQYAKQNVKERTKELVQELEDIETALQMFKN